MAGRMRGRLVMLASGGLGIRGRVFLVGFGLRWSGLYLLGGEAFLCGGVW